MSAKLPAPSRHLLTAMVRVSLLGALLLTLAALGSMACEDNGIGRPCDVGADAGQSQAVYNNQALQCPSRLCLKPIDQVGGVDTGPLCSSLCSTDSDCGGPTRDASDPNDTRCAGGYACSVAFIVGPLCCAKVCLCSDFLAQPVQIPNACNPDGGMICQF